MTIDIKGSKVEAVVKLTDMCIDTDLRCMACEKDKATHLVSVRVDSGLQINAQLCGKCLAHPHRAIRVMMRPKER